MLQWPPGEKIDIFGIFEVQHTNQGWAKYGIYKRTRWKT